MPLLQHRDAVAEGHRLGLVVGDVDGGDAEPALQPAISVRIWPRSLASRFDSGSSNRNAVGLADDRAPHRHALPLAAREVGRLALEVLVELERRRGLADLLRRSPLVELILASRSGKAMFS